MLDLTWPQTALIAIIFAWSGFVRTGLGFGGALMSMPFLLLVDNRPLVYLPIIAVHLLIFSSITVYQNNRLHSARNTSNSFGGTVAWSYLGHALSIMIVPKLIGVLGLITLPTSVMSGIIFGIVIVYSGSYILNKPFRSKNRLVDAIFLMLGAYISGTSLIGAPLIMAVFASHVAKEQLRDTLFVLWFILVVIKMIAFIGAGVDLQLIHHLWLLPAATVGHLIGLRFHSYLIQADTRIFYRVIGVVLLIASIFGLMRGF